MRAVVMIICGIAAMVGGCAGKKAPQPLGAPRATLELRHFTGTPLSGPMALAAAVGQPADALAVKVRLIAVSGLSADALAPLSSRARMIVVTRSNEPVMATAELTAGVRFATGDTTGPFIATVDAAPIEQKAEMRSFTDALAAGTTSEFDIAFSSSESVFRPQRITLQLHRPADRPQAVQLGLAIEDFVNLVTEIVGSSEATVTETQTNASPPAQGSAMKRELVVIDDIDLTQPLHGVVYVPCSFASANDGVVFDVTIAPGSIDDQAHVDALSRAAADLTQSAAAVTAQPGTPPTSPATGYATALAAMQNPDTRRSAMLFLATQSRSPLLGDLAIVGGNDLLQILATRIAEQAAALTDARSGGDPGWTLETIAIAEVVALQAAEKLPQELQAVVIQHYGEAGRNPSSLQQIAKGPPSRAEFENRLTAENLIYLEDSSPSSRVRAYDWLGSRKLAPAGYDPLGPIKQRRAALEKVLYSPAPTTQGGVQ